MKPYLPALFAAFATPLSAASIFSENFNGVPAGTAVTAGGSGNTNYSARGGGGQSANLSQTGTLDTGDLFGQGTSNIYNRTVDTNNPGATSLIKNGFTSSPDLVTYSFDFNDAGSTGTYQFRLSTEFGAESSYNAAAVFGGTAINGVASAFNYNQTYRLDLVANTGGSTANFLDGNGISRSVGADSFSIFLTTLDRTSQTIVQNNVAFNGSQSKFAGFDSIAFQTFGSAVGINVAWDNVNVEDTALVTTVVPEPSSALLLLGGFGAMILRRKRG